MAVTTIIQSTTVDGVGNLTQSDIVQDPDTGEYVRQIQVFAPPDSSGNAALQFTLTVKGATKGAVEFTAPSVQF